jgi:hypothetical protein
VRTDQARWKRRDEDHGHSAQFPQNVIDGIYAAAVVGKLNVRQYQVRFAGRNKISGCTPVAGATNDRVSEAKDDLLQISSNEKLILDNDDARGVLRTCLRFRLLHEIEDFGLGHAYDQRGFARREAFHARQQIRFAGTWRHAGYSPLLRRAAIAHLR